MFMLKQTNKPKLETKAQSLEDLDKKNELSAKRRSLGRRLQIYQAYPIKNVFKADCKSSKKYMVMSNGYYIGTYDSYVKAELVSLEHTYEKIVEVSKHLGEPVTVLTPDKQYSKLYLDNHRTDDKDFVFGSVNLLTPSFADIEYLHKHYFDKLSESSTNELSQEHRRDLFVLRRLLKLYQDLKFKKA